MPEEDYVRFVNLCHLWEKHIVITTTEGKLWGFDKISKSGYGRYWEYRAIAMFATMHTDGINVVDFSSQYLHYRRTYPEIRSGALHFANTMSTTTMWHDLMNRVAEAMTTGFVSASWKVAARTKGGLAEQQSKNELVTEMRPQTDAEKMRTVLQKTTPLSTAVDSTSAHSPATEVPKGSAVVTEENTLKNAFDDVENNEVTRGSAAGGDDGAKGSALEEKEETGERNRTRQERRGREER